MVVYSGSQDNSEYPFQRDEVPRILYNKDRSGYKNSGELKNIEQPRKIIEREKKKLKRVRKK